MTRVLLAYVALLRHVDDRLATLPAGTAGAAVRSARSHLANAMRDLERASVAHSLRPARKDQEP